MDVSEVLREAARLGVAVFFLIAAFRNSIHFRERVPAMTNYGTALPVPLVATGFAMQWAGGLGLLLGGVAAVWGAVVLIVFLVLATALFHNPLAFPRKERDLHLYLLLVNSTFVCVLLTIAAEALSI